METMIELERARELIFKHIALTGKELVPLHESYDRVLGEDVYARRALPAFARSPLDGYAYWAEASQEQLRLEIVSEIPAGTWPTRELQTGQAAKIFTGAPLPKGANCVVRVEDTEQDGQNVIIHQPVAAGSNVVPEGDEMKAGELLITEGTLLTPPAVGLLATVGISEVVVYKQPRVGLLTTGSELVEAGQELPPGKIYNSNSYTLRGLLQQAGCEVKAAALVADNLVETVEALRGLQTMDIIVTTGGASIGDYDLMGQALAQAGCELLFWKVNLKPGTPVAVGVNENRVYFSLSGNPAAAMVTFELLVRPAVRKCAGLTAWEEREFSVKMASGFGKGGRQRRFLRAKAILRDGEIWADPSVRQGTGILRTMMGSHLLVDVPAGHGEVKAGEYLQARWIADWEEYK